MIFVYQQIISNNSVKQQRYSIS